MLPFPTRRRLGSYIPPEASLILNFAERRAVRSGKQVNLQSIITFDRAGVAWGVGDGGVLRQHAANEMRMARLGTGPAGVILERQATNLMLYSRDLSNGAWTKSGATVVQTATGLDGEEAVSLCTDTTAAGTTSGKWSQTRPVAATNQWLTISIFVRQLVGERMMLYAGLAGGSSVKGGQAVFNTRLGAVISAQAGVVARVEPAAMGFVRLCLSIRNDVGATACVLQVSRESDAAAPIVFAADFAQMEVGSRATSPILTNAAQADRVGDRIRINPVDDWFNPYEGTLYVEATVGGAQEYNRSIIRFAGPTGSLEIAAAGATTSVDVLSIVNGAVQGGSSAAGYNNPPRQLRIAARYKANDFAFSVSGVQTPYDGESMGTPRVITLGGATDVPVYTAMEIGANAGTAQVDGTIAKVIYIPFALDDARLAAAVL